VCNELVTGDLELSSLLPIAIAMALSSVPITATLVILLSPRRQRSSIPFLVGWMLSIGLVVLAAASGTFALRRSLRGEQLTAIATAGIVLGGVLVILAILAWRRSGHARPTRKSWLDSLGSVGPLAAFGVGFAMGFRPKALLLGAAAGLGLASNSLTQTKDAIAIGLYIVVSASTVAVPVIWTLVSPNRMEPRLVRWRGWLDQHGEIVTAIITMIIGVVVIGAGIADLL
jgi:drug/metabolite transporter (DMT)-like permease